MTNAIIWTGKLERYGTEYRVVRLMGTTKSVIEKASGEDSMGVKRWVEEHDEETRDKVWQEVVRNLLGQLEPKVQYEEDSMEYSGGV